MFRRAYLSVKGRKTKNIIMLLFLFIVSTLVLCSISIKNATNKSMELAKESLGGTVTLSMDMSKLRDEFKKEDQGSIEDKKSQMQDMHEKIEKDILKDMFKPYNKGSKGENGLGLSILKANVDLIGYKVVAKNTKEGVEFIINKNSK